MSKPIIKIENIGKRYAVGPPKESYLSLRDEIRKFAFRIAKRGRSAAVRDFWALKNISFEVQEGAAVGIIGRNGAGKSTLPKVLSQITPPTEGKITIRGRVASLLEVGTGFHPELTGRENIFLNGAILGMTRREVRRKFDEIVAFAEIERFLDTPVKRYSSGMYVRLAFAVAAHLEPEILVVDEVLAVGDAEFQKKCLGKMSEATRGGRTVLFVSHNLTAIEALCSKGIVLNAGELTFNSDAQDAVHFYLEQLHLTIGSTALAERKGRSGSGRVTFVGLRIVDETGQEVSFLQSGKNYRFEIEFHNVTSVEISNVACSIDIHDERNLRVMMMRTSFSNMTLSLKPGVGRFSCLVNDLALANGSYRIALFMYYAERELLDRVEDAAVFNVDGGDFFGTGSQGLPIYCRTLTRAMWSN